MLELTIILIVIFVYFDYSRVKHGYKASRYTNTSGFNPVKLLDGKRWSTTQEIKDKYGDNKGVFIGYFRFSPKVKKEVKFMPTWFKKHHESTAIYFDPIKHLRETTMCYGGQGSGKSTGFINLLDQTQHYHNALIHDGGKNEMCSRYYNGMRDIIVNPFDDRCTIVDILDHDPLLATEYFNLLLKSTDSKTSFFTKGSLEHFKNIVLMTNRKRFTCKKQKWSYFMKKIDELIVSILKETQKSETDIISTLKQQMEPFFLMNYRIQNDTPTVNLDEFLSSKQANKLFISYPDILKSMMQPYSASMVYLYIMVLLSKPDTKSFKRLLLIDEFSSFLRLIDFNEGLLKDILEKPRSKGGMVIGGFQGIEEKTPINSIIQKTCKQRFFYRTDGRDTKNDLVNSVGKINYELETITKSNNGNSISVGTKESNLIKEDDFFELGENHEFIAQLGDQLVRGYTPLPFTSKQAKQRCEGYIEYSKRQEFDDFMALRYENFQKLRIGKNKAKDIADKYTKNKKD